MTGTDRDLMNRPPSPRHPPSGLTTDDRAASTDHADTDNHPTSGGLRWRQQSMRFEVRTGGRGLVEITGPIRQWVTGCGIQNGLLTVFIRHTSASLVVQENADPDVRTDLETFFARLVPDGDPDFVHDAEGPDDMPAHVRAALTQTSLGIPVLDGRPALGTWQGIYLYEHRHQGHRREVVLHLLGEG
jgi:secondary thiamine-phosphate synthase enzyme